MQHRGSQKIDLYCTCVCSISWYMNTSPIKNGIFASLSANISSSQASSMFFNSFWKAHTYTVTKRIQYELHKLQPPLNYEVKQEYQVITVPCKHICLNIILKNEAEHCSTYCLNVNHRFWIKQMMKLRMPFNMMLAKQSWV